MSDMGPGSPQAGRPAAGGEFALADTDEVERWMIDLLEVPEDERALEIEGFERVHPELKDKIRSRIVALHSVGICLLPSRPPEMPERLGDFRLLARLGGGGMGIVYRARQESLGREVALKLIRPEQLYFPGARERFRREVEAIAKLSHPGIVPVYLAGEEQGVPYFAMELVVGLSLADALRALAGRASETLHGRDLELAIARALGREPALDGEIALFAGTWVQCCLRIAARVARALEHAHERGVLHRDVKPSNVLVTLDGRALLFDFGLASAVGSDRLTRTGAQVGSLPYMSPEQVRDGKLDERSDVYSLGVTLFELLTLRLPFDIASADALRAAIAAGDAPSPRAFAPSMAWDAETVVQAAMERDRARRYPSALALAQDLERVLELRPIEARRPSPALRARLWVQRHPTATVAAGLGLLALTIGPSVAAFMARASERAVLAEMARTNDERLRADHAAAEAQAEAQTSRAVVDFLLDLFRESDPLRGGAAGVTALELLERGARAIPSEFADRPRVRAELMSRVGTILLHLGRPREALPLLSAALEELPRTHGPQSLRTASCARSLGIVLKNLDRTEEAQAAFERALAIYHQLPDTGGRDIDFVRNHLATALIERGCSEEAEALQREVSASLIGSESEFPVHRVHALDNLGQLQCERRQYSAAEESFTSARNLALETLGVNHMNTAIVTRNLAVLLRKVDRPAAALPLLEEAAFVLRGLTDGASAEVVYTEFSLAGVYLDLDRPRESAESYGRLLPSLTELLGPEHSLTSKCRTNLGEALFELGELVRAEAELRAALALAERVFGVPSADENHAARLLASTLAKLGRHAEAADVFGRVLDHSRELGLHVRPWFAVCLCEAAEVDVELGQLDRGIERLTEAHGIYSAAAGSARARKHASACVSALVELCERQGRFVDAELWRQQLGE